MNTCPLAPGTAASLLALAVLVCSQAQADSITVTLLSGEGRIIKTPAGRERVCSPGFGSTLEPGKPMMPLRVFHIAVPPDAVDIGVRFHGPRRLIEGRHDIQPAGMVLPAGSRDPAVIAAARALFQANQDSTYSRDDPFPAREAEFLGTGGLRKYKLLRIRYCPWQFRPRSGRMLHCPELTVTVEFERSGRLPAHLCLSDTVGEQRARNLIANFDQAAEWYQAALAAPTSQPVPTASSDYRYVIMCTEATRDAVETLANWKRSIGNRVRVFTKEWLQANTNYPDWDLERQIRYYLRDNYQAWNTEYFLIVGDQNQIPMRYCESASDGEAEVKPSTTDLYYAELSEVDTYSSWDDDWDGRFGEWDDDNIDWLIELDVGRIPDNNPAVVQAICDKIRSYELDTGSWKNRGLFAGAIVEFDNDNGHLHLQKCDSAYAMEEMLNDWSWSGWNVYTMYEQDGIDPSAFSGTSTYPLTQPMMRATINNGNYGVVNMAGHSSGFGIHRRIWHWDDGDGIPLEITGEMTGPQFFDRDDIQGLDDSHPAIFFLAGCSCACRFDPFPFAKQVLENGGIASIGASDPVDHNNPWFDEDGGLLFTLQYEWNKRLVHHGMRAGSALIAAKEDYATKFTMDASAVQLLLSMNYFGDPSLSRTGVTQRVNLDYHRPAQWDYAVVPRGANDATSSWCPVSATLPGGEPSTYLNFALTNNGNATGYEVRSNLYVDDGFKKWAKWGWVPPGATPAYPNIGPVTVKGGRHTLKVVYDPDNTLTEINESDNEWSRQYVWSPTTLDGAPLACGPPPDPGTGSWPNCDGFRASMRTLQNWCAVGMLPVNSTGDNNLRLYHGYSGSTSGFDSYWKASNNPSGRSDFCLVNRRHTGSAGPYFFGVVSQGAGRDYHIQKATSGALLNRTGYSGPFTLEAYDTLDLHEVYLVPATWRVFACVEDGAADIGLSVYDGKLPYFSKNEAMPGGMTDTAGPGSSESLNLGVAAGDYYGIAVWKSGSNDLATTCSYYLGVFEDADLDGLPDVWEQQIIDDDPGDGINDPADVTPQGDYDGDRSNNWTEFIARTDPTDGTMCLAIIDIHWNPDDSLSLVWSCVESAAYRVEYCSSVETSDWLPAGDPVTASTTGILEWRDDGSSSGGPPALSTKRFYRVAVIGPTAP